MSEIHPNHPDAEHRASMASIEELDHFLLRRFGEAPEDPRGTDEALHAYDEFVRSQAENCSERLEDGIPLQNELEVYAYYLPQALSAAVLHMIAHGDEVERTDLRPHIILANACLAQIIVDGQYVPEGENVSPLSGLSVLDNTAMLEQIKELAFSFEMRYGPRLYLDAGETGRAHIRPVSLLNAQRGGRSSRGSSRTVNESTEDPVRQYMEEIGRYELLTQDEEVELAQLIEAGRAAQAMLSDRRLTPAERAEMQSLVDQGNEARRAFTNANLRLVIHIAKRYQNQGLPLLDLIQEGNLGLMHAVGKFDWRMGFKFSTYADNWIRQSIRRGIDHQARMIRYPSHVRQELSTLSQTQAGLELEGIEVTDEALADKSGLSLKKVRQLQVLPPDAISLQETIRTTDDETELGDLIADPVTSGEIEGFIETSKFNDSVEFILGLLDDTLQKEVLCRRFGLDGGGLRTLVEVGREMGYSGTHIGYIERRAFIRIRRRAKDLDIDVSQLLG